MISKNLLINFKNKTTLCFIPNKIILCFIPGFNSNFITSKKSNIIYEYAIKNNLGFLSWNHVNQGNIVDWYKDGIEIMKEYKNENTYYIGASMGLWISLLLSINGFTPKGIISIGGGIDFTQKWLKEAPKNERNNRDFIWKRPSKYDSSGYYNIPISFLIDSKEALIMSNYKEGIHINCPIQLIHGTLDEDVSIQTAKNVYHYLSLKSNNNISFHEIKDGDHQLSRSQDLNFICKQIESMINIAL